jgi:hypothetical protein
MTDSPRAIAAVEGDVVPAEVVRDDQHLEEAGPLSQGAQARREALRIRHINGTKVRKKNPKGFKKEAQGGEVSPLNPLSVSP